MDETILPPNRTPPEMVPVSGMNPWWWCVAGARQVMFTGNLPQANVIDGAMRKRQRSGLEYQAARGTVRHEFRNDAIIKARIKRFTSLKSSEQFALQPVEIIIFEDPETHVLDYIELTKFHVMHQHYGFRFKYNEEVLDRLQKGASIKAGTLIATSPNITEDGDYMYGLETNVAMISDPSGTEDGIAFANSYARRIRTTGYEKRVFSCGRSHYPINVNGNAEEYKVIPDIGEKILGSGVICAMRPYDKYLDAIYMSQKNLYKPIYGMDVPTYGIPEATIVDVKVLHNDRLDNPRMPERMGEQLRRYWEADKRYYMEIIKVCLARSGRYLADDVGLSYKLNALLRYAISICGHDLVAEGLWSRSEANVFDTRLNYRGELLDEYRVEVTFEYKTAVGEGPKATDCAGGKGVSVAVWRDEDMPKDRFGNVADVVIFSGSTVNRMNPGRCHEQVVGAAGRDVIKRIRRSYDFPDMGPIPDEVVERVVRDPANEALGLRNFAYLLGFYKLVSPEKNYASLSKESVITSGRWLRHLITVIHDGTEPYGLFFDLPSDTEVKPAELIKELDEGIYRPEMSPVTYRDLGGELVETVADVLIGPNYYLALEKLASDWSGVSSSKVGPFGTTARLTNADKYSSPGRQTVTRSIGESEGRNHAAAYGGEYVAHIMDMNNNPTVHKEVCRNLITAEYPTNIDRIVDRTKFKLGGHRPLAFAVHQLQVSGKGISRE